MPRPLLLGLTLSAALSAMLSAPVMAQTVTVTVGNGTGNGNATAASASETPSPAKTLIDQAVKTAKAEHKAVLVHVGASWCGWCHKLDQVLGSPEIAPLMAASYVIVPLDALEEGSKKSLENPGVDSVMKALGLHGGPPLYAFLDADGKEIATSFAVPPNNDNIGYPAEPQEIVAFGELLKKTAPNMSDADRTKITDYLTAHAPKQH